MLVVQSVGPKDLLTRASIYRVSNWIQLPQLMQVVCTICATFATAKSWHFISMQQKGREGEMHL